MIELVLTPQNTLQIQTETFVLGAARPVINGAPVEGTSCEVVQADATLIELRYTSPALGGGAFGIRAHHPDGGGHIWLRYWCEALPKELALDSFGLRFERLENLRAYLRNGYFSWDGSYFVQPEALLDFEEYETRPERGFALTQLLPRSGGGSLVAGFDRHDRFQHTFTFETQRQPDSLTIETWWDRKPRAGKGRCESERLVIFAHPEVENALREWARLVAGASPTPPRLSGPPITGWCSWYNLYGYITEENILDHLTAAAEVVRREKLPLSVFQIDDGFTPEMGDWLEIKPQFPRGMKPLLDDIRAAGFIPGLWIGPFMVGNRSRLYREHPDWVVKDRQSGGPLVQWRLYGEFRWHKRSEEYFILDATHPEAFEYLRNVFRTWRQDWGCEYFKTDFMHFGSEHGPERARWHAPGLTRIEIWRRVAEMIRTEIGEATWLGCGCPLWASVGLVDGIRIGSDVGVTWSGGLSAQSLLRDQASRNFTNHILYQIDPDCVLLRDRFHHLSDQEIESLAIYAGMSGGAIMTSDHLGDLSSARLDLLRMILPESRATCDFPLLGQAEISYARLPADLESQRVRHIAQPADPVLVQVRQPASAESYGAIYIFNPSSATLQRRYPLKALGVHEAVYLKRWGEAHASHEPVSQISLSLPAHHSALYFFSLRPIKAAPLSLDGGSKGRHWISD